MSGTRVVGIAEVRLTRVMAGVLGAASLLFGLLAEPELTAQLPYIPFAWTAAVLLGTTGCGIAVIVASFRAPLPLVRGLLTAIAVTYLLSLITLGLVLGPHLVPVNAGSPWVLEISAVGTGAAAIAWRPFAAWAYLVAASVLLGIDRIIASTAPIGDIAFQDALFTLMFDSVFTALGLATRRAARRQDVAAAAAIAETLSASTADARLRERGRVEAIVHDTVLVALLASARSAPPGVVASVAQRAIQQIGEAAGDDRSAPGPYTAEAAAWVVQAMTTELDPSAAFSYEADAADGIPGEVVTAVSEAAAESLRNSLAHAGDSASRAVHVIAAAGRLEVTVLDDGAGFDIHTVPPARLGLSVSVLGRMAAIPGGDARIVSESGIGTRVAITWTAPDGAT